MDFSEILEQVKPVLREKWLDYYELNRHWIETAKIHQEKSWSEDIEGENITLYCPNSILMIAVITALDKTVNGFLHISTQLTGRCYSDSFVENLGLRFDPDIALKNREVLIEKISEVQESEILILEANTDLLNMFNQVKSELRKKWITYYIANQDWIKFAGLHQGCRWNEVIDEKPVTLYCPDVHLMLGVASSLDKRVAGLINISIQLTGICDLKAIAKGLGLVFDVESVLAERRRIIKERREMQDEKIKPSVE